MLTSVSIRNFKAIKDETVLLSPLTIFAGYNGLGKSSILQVLLLLRQSYKNGDFSRGLFLRDDLLLQLGIGKDILSVDADPQETLAFTLEFEYDHELKLEFTPDKGSDVLPLTKELKDENFALENEPIFSRNFQYLCANRINPQVQYKASSYFVEQLQSLGKTGEYTVHYLAKNQDSVINNELLQHPKAKSNTLIDNVNAWLAEISPGVKAITTLHPDLEVASLNYQFETKYDYTESFKPTHVGFGLTYVLPVITAVLMSKAGDLIIVENPESHLHPAGQAKIGHLFAKAAGAGIQIIMETHSDHVINGVRVAVKQDILEGEDVSLYFIDRDIDQTNHESKIIPVYIDDKGKIEDWPMGFMDEWEKQLSDLLGE
ncbi:DUF3696 domain-containing protein [Puteibacter caeruleilacunae]|nr:DUF3696 domain-containing protein [Puteibacter caeruleilacunae]